MSLLKTKTISYYDWNEVKKEVETQTGRNIRNWAMYNYYDGSQDFWHKLLEVYESEIHNESYVDINFEVIADFYEHREPTNYKWIREVCDAFIKVLGPGQADIGNNMGEYYTFEMSR